MATNTDTVPFVRWVIRRDLSEVLEIERDLSTPPWCEDKWLTYLRSRSSIGVVAEDGSKIIGAMIYTMCNFGLLIERVISRTTPGADAMIERLKDKLSHQRRTWLETIVDESDLQSQLFFQRHGFVCVGIEHGPDTGYRFVFSLPL